MPSYGANMGVFEAFLKGDGEGQAGKNKTIPKAFGQDKL